MAIRYERHRTSPDAVFAVEDAHARRRLDGAGQRLDAAGRPLSVARHPRPLGRVVFRVVGPRIGGVIQRYSEPTTMVLTQTGSGFSVFGREIAVQLEDGGTVRRRLRDGVYSVQVESDAYQPFPPFDMTLPNPSPDLPRQVDLEPGYAYPFGNESPLRQDIPIPDCTAARQQEGRGPTLLRGGLHGPDGGGIEGAVITVLGLARPSYRTDATGEWVLPFPDSHLTGPVALRVTPPAGPVVIVPGVCVVKGRETRLRETALRGSVLRAGLGVEGATVAVTGRSERATTGADGGWSIYFGPGQAQATVTLTARSPTGQEQPANNISVTPRITTLVPPFQFP